MRLSTGSSAEILHFPRRINSDKVSGVLAELLLNPTSLSRFKGCSFEVSNPVGIELEMNQHALKGGKRFRALLVFLAAELVGEQNASHIERLARAAEQVHAAFLCHDDVIDDASERRGRPSLNRSTSNRFAILAGDALLARVMVDVAAMEQPGLVSSLAQAISDTVDGEVWQDKMRWNTQVTLGQLQSIGSRKTGALFAWTASSPAQLSRCPLEVVEALGNFGRILGVLFQMADDALDFDRLSEKEFGKDLREGLMNSATLSLLDACPKLRSNFEFQFAHRSFSKFWSQEDWILGSELHHERMLFQRNLASQELQILQKLLPAATCQSSLDRFETMLLLSSDRRL